MLDALPDLVLFEVIRSLCCINDVVQLSAVSSRLRHVVRESSRTAHVHLAQPNATVFYLLRQGSSSKHRSDDQTLRIERSDSICRTEQRHLKKSIGCANAQKTTHCFFYSMEDMLSSTQWLFTVSTSLNIDPWKKCAVDNEDILSLIQGFKSTQARNAIRSMRITGNFYSYLQGSIDQEILFLTNLRPLIEHFPNLCGLHMNVSGMLTKLHEENPNLYYKSINEMEEGAVEIYARKWIECCTWTCKLLGNRDSNSSAAEVHVAVAPSLVNNVSMYQCNNNTGSVSLRITPFRDGAHKLP